MAGRARDVLVAPTLARRAMRFVRELDLPAGTSAKLLLKVGQEGDSRWRLEVSVDGESLLSETIEPGQTNNGWKQLEVDLSRFAGQRHWLIVSQHDPTNKQVPAYWKRLEVATPPVVDHN